ncbi:MAG: hypothetical protein ACRD32_06645 [Nitrososphaerales archaeon]
MKNQKRAAPLSKHDVLSHVWIFVHYVEERMAAPKLFDKSVMVKKCEQVKRILTEADRSYDKRE